MTGVGVTGGGGRLRVLGWWTVMLASAALLALQLTWHGHLSGVSEYDDGVYFASADALVHGVLPYRDYAFIQPPLVAVLLAPCAFTARWLGSAHAFELARVLVALVALLNVGLVGRLLRGRPTPELLAGMAVMALYPGAVSSAQTVLIEPLLALLCLLALLALLPGVPTAVALGDRPPDVATDLASSKPARHWLTGALFGIAVATKIWALAPLLVTVGVLWWLSRRTVMPMRAVWRVVAGAALSFGLACAPFAITSLSAFAHQVFVVQSIRPPGGYARPERLADLSGLANLVQQITTTGPIRSGCEVAAAVLVAMVVVRVGRSWRRSRATSPLEWVAIGSAVSVGISLFAAPTYYYHYSGFMAPFLALAAPRVVAGLRAQSSRPERARSSLRGRTSVRCGPVVAGLVVVAVALTDVAATVRSPRPLQVSSAFARALPAEGCVLSMQPSLTLLAGRQTTSDPGCPRAIDYLGTERVLARGLSQDPADEAAPRLQRQLLDWLQSSSAIVVAAASPSWGPAARAYVARHFTRIDIPAQRVVVYVRQG